MALYYVSADKLRDTIGARAFVVCFDDDDDGVADVALVNLVLGRASRRVDGFLAGAYAGPYPLDPVPALAEEAALEFATAMAYLRRQEFAKRYAERGKIEEFIRAEQLCKELRLNFQKMPDAAKPPANAGGGVYFGPTDSAPCGVGGGFWKNGFGGH